MSGVDTIVQKILDDAEKEKQRILTQAQTEVEERKRDLERTCEARKSQAQKRAEEKAEQIYRRTIANAMLEGRKMKLQARRESVDEAFEKAMDRLCSLSEEKYLEVMVRLVLPCLEDRGTNEIIPTAFGSARHAARLVEELETSVPEKTVVLSEETVPGRGGVVVKNGRVQTNLTFETLLRFGKDALESEVTRILFEGSE
jgi:V/A-type H+/Na+-transporting ATPase subunit E